MEQQRQAVKARTKPQIILLSAILAVLLLIGTLQIVQFVTVQKAIDSLQTNALGVDVEEVNKAVGSLTEAADNLSKVDVEALNKTAGSLKDASEKLSKVDMEALNKMVESIAAVTEQLEKTVKGITTIGGLFGN